MLKIFFSVIFFIVIIIFNGCNEDNNSENDFTPTPTILSGVWYTQEPTPTIENLVTPTIVPSQLPISTISAGDYWFENSIYYQNNNQYGIRVRVWPVDGETVDVLNAGDSFRAFGYRIVENGAIWLFGCKSDLLGGCTTNSVYVAEWLLTKLEEQSE